MFSEACSIYWNLVCQVGGGSATEKGRLFGTGCSIDKQHVLTARHTVTRLHTSFRWPVVLTNDGLHRCEVVLESRKCDLMLLRKVEHLHQSNLGTVSRYPTLASNYPKHGALVGFIARLRQITSDGTNDSHAYFGTGCISMMVPQEDVNGLYFMLSDGIVQSGFSGGPVFSSDGTLFGLIVQSYQFPVDTNQKVVMIHTKPVMSPLFPILTEINKALS